MDYTNWKESYDKWDRIVALIKKKIRFYRIEQWAEKTIVSSCGYCNEYHDRHRYREDNYCRNCILYKQNICSTIYDSTNSFWRTVDLLVKINQDREEKEELWNDALIYSKEVLNAIISHGSKLGYNN